MNSTDTVLSLLSLERPNFDGAIQIIRSAETLWDVQILDDHDPSTLPYALRIMVGDLSLSTIRRRLRSWEALERITIGLVRRGGPSVSCHGRIPPQVNARRHGTVEGWRHALSPGECTL